MMLCPECGRENTERVARARPRISGMAVASLVVSSLGVVATVAAVVVVELYSAWMAWVVPERVLWLIYVLPLAGFILALGSVAGRLARLACVVVLGALILGVVAFPRHLRVAMVVVNVFPILGVAALVRIRGKALVSASIVVSLIGGFFVMFMAMPGVIHDYPATKKAVCLSNVKNLTLALQMYLSDNDDVFPPSAGWCESVEPYVKNAEVFRCPAAKDKDVTCAYAYNGALSGVRLEALVDPVATVAIFESDKGWNATGGLRLVAIEPRHLRGDNFGFADGHAAWWNRERMLSDAEGCRWEVE